MFPILINLVLTTFDSLLWIVKCKTAMKKWPLAFSFLSRRDFCRRLIVVWLSINKVFIIAKDFAQCLLMMGTKYGRKIGQCS